MKDIKVVFMGTPEFAVPILEELIETTNVTLVVSQPDKKVGRHQELRPSPIKEVAIKYHIPVFQPEKIRNDFRKIIEEAPDLIVTCAYGQIIPRELLELPRLGCINVHASLLPKLRGGAPIHHAIIDGYKDTGITIMYMDEGMDTGDIISKSSYQIKEDDTTEVLHDILSQMGRKLLKETLPSIIDGTNDRIKQDESEATYGYNIKREEEHIDFSKTCKEIYNQVRGLYSWPTANFILDDEEWKVLACKYKQCFCEEKVGTIKNVSKDSIDIVAGDGIILVTKIKPFGKKAMLVKDFFNGFSKEKLLGKVVE